MRLLKVAEDGVKYFSLKTIADKFSYFMAALSEIWSRYGREILGLF